MQDFVTFLTLNENNSFFGNTSPQAENGNYQLVI